jgi:enediyne biosynthesis protein E4
LVGDFDNDKVSEAILATAIDGVYYPIHPRDDLLQQLPSFKKYYPDYRSYSHETMDAFVKRLGSAPVSELRCEVATSAILFNGGEAGMRLDALPMEAQVAPVNGILIEDFTGDGKVDILLSGNSFAPDALTGRYDAMKGIVLSGIGNGKFASLGQESGLVLGGDTKGLASIVAADGHLMVLGTCNDDSVRVYKLQGKQKVLSVNPTERFADIFFADGSRSRVEFYRGGGYLSQSPARIMLPQTATRIILHDYKGATRTYNND